MKTKLQFRGENLKSMVDRYQLERVEWTKDTYERETLLFKKNHGVFLEGEFRRHDRFASFLGEWMDAGFEEEMARGQNDFPLRACFFAKELLSDGVLVVKRRPVRPKAFQTEDVRHILLYPFGMNGSFSYAYRMKELKARLCLLFKKEGIFFIKEEQRIKTASVTYHFSMENTFSDEQLLAFDETYKVEPRTSLHLNIFEPFERDLLQALYNETVHGANDVTVYQWNKEQDDIEQVSIPKGLLDDTHCLSREAFIEKETSRLERNIVTKQAQIEQSLKNVDLHMKQVKERTAEQQKQIVQQFRLRELANKKD